MWVGHPQPVIGTDSGFCLCEIEEAPMLLYGITKQMARNSRKTVGWATGLLPQGVA